MAIHPDVQSIFCLSHILHGTPVAADHVHNVFCFACKLAPDGVFPARGITGKRVGGFGMAFLSSSEMCSILVGVS